MGKHFSWDSHQGTDKQNEIMRHVFEAVDAGEQLSLSDLYTKLSYANQCSRTAVYGSVTYLEKKWGLISKTGSNGGYIYLLPTPKAYTIYRPTLPETITLK